MSTPAPDALLEHLKAMVAKARADQQESARLGPTRSRSGRRLRTD